MSIKSQAEVESQYQQRQAEVQSGQLSPEQAFGNMDDWIIQLGQRKALLHPGVRKWMWFDRLHNEWVLTGFGVGEAILLSIGSVAGVKKLRQRDDVAGWCVYRQGQELFGPLWSGEMIDRFKSQPELKNILVWSPRATDWLTVVYDPQGEIYFADKTGKQVSITAIGKPVPVTASLPDNATLIKFSAPARMLEPPHPPTVKKKSNRNLIIAIVVIVVLLCFCFPAMVAIVYFVAKTAGFLPTWLGGSAWAPLLML